MFKQLLKDSSIYGLADFILKIIAFFTFPIFANLLNLQEYGIMSFALVIAGFVAMFINLGLNNAVQRYYFDSETKESDRPLMVSSAYIALVVWSLLLTIICIGIAYLFRSYILEQYQLPFSYLSIALLTNIPLQLLMFSTDVIRLHFKPRLFFILSLCRNLGSVILAIILMVYFGMGMWGYFVANFLGVAIFIPLGIYYTRSECKLIFSSVYAKKLIKFGYPFIFSGLAYWLFGSMDRWMLGQWSTMTEAGIYSIAFRLGSIILFVNSAFGQAWSPIAIKVMSDHPENHKTLFSKLFTYWFALILIVGIGVSFFSAEFLRFTTPESYWSADNTAIWVSMGLVISGTTQLTAIGISISKKTAYFTYIAWFTAIINFGLNLLLIPYWGALGSAVATFFTYIVLSSCYLFISQKLYFLPIEYLKLILLLILLFVSIFIATWFNSLLWNWTLIIYKLSWIGFVAIVFFKFKILDIAQLKLFLKRNNG